MLNIIIGNGISAYIIAACLEYKKEKFYIYSTTKETHIPSIMHLKYNNEEELEFYKKLFKIKKEENYIKKVKVGYIYQNNIVENLTDEIKQAYLKKQNRDAQSSSMNDADSTYNAIDLSLVFKNLINRYSDKVIIRNVSKKDILVVLLNRCNVYDTIGLYKDIEKHAYKYYLANTESDLFGYDYLYDCDDNNVKRITPTTIEFITKPNNCDSIELTNYYDEFKVIEEKTFGGDYICIGRYATGTQTKQKDIINYMIKGEQR